MTKQTSPHSRRWWILALAGIAQLMVVLDVTVVNVALPSAQAALHFSNDQRQWIVTAYSLAFGSMLLLGGKLGDLFGRKRTLIGGATGFALASALGGAAPSFAVFAGARALQGARHLRRDRRQRRLDRPAARRRADAAPRLALRHVRQRALRGAHRRRCARAASQRGGAGEDAAARPRRHGHRLRRPVRDRLRPLPRRDLELEQSADGRAPRLRRGAARALRLDRGTGGRAAPAPAGTHRPHPECLPRLHPDRHRVDHAPPRVAPGTLVALGMAISAAGMLYLTRLGMHASYAADILPSLLALGGGLGLIFPTTFNNGTRGVDSHDAGVTTSHQVGG